MIDVFERLAPSYGRVLRKYALDVWYNRANPGDLLRKADYFKRRYELELFAYFRKMKYAYTPARVYELGNLWLADQVTTARKIEIIAKEKKTNLLEEIAETQEKEVRTLFEQLKNPSEGVSPVVSFSQNFQARAIQLGEQAAFELGREINHAVVSQNSEVYIWTSQGDVFVRPTHRKLAGKLFDYRHPPTTIDRYGHQHTGNPGTDWGCRCFEKAAQGKPLIGYIARA